MHYYLLFVLAWTFFHSLWLSKISKQVAELNDRLERLRRSNENP